MIEKFMSIVAAVAENGVIGGGNQMPWSLRSDMRRFAKLTTGSINIVGRKTQDSILESLGHPLRQRITLVVTRNKRLSYDGCYTFDSFIKAVEYARAREKEFFVIGGREIYELALPMASKLYLTRVLASPEGDTYFPEGFKLTDWIKTLEEFHEKGNGDQFDFYFENFERKNGGR